MANPTQDDEDRAAIMAAMIVSFILFSKMDDVSFGIISFIFVVLAVGANRFRRPF